VSRLTPAMVASSPDRNARAAVFFTNNGILNCGIYSKVKRFSRFAPENALSLYNQWFHPLPVNYV